MKALTYLIRWLLLQKPILFIKVNMRMSSLLTPPSERLGVRTFVKEYSDALIKEVILREKRRARLS
jgi:hypothetical protein